MYLLYYGISLGIMTSFEVISFGHVEDVMHHCLSFGKIDMHTGTQFVHSLSQTQPILGLWCPIGKMVMAKRLAKTMTMNPKYHSNTLPSAIYHLS